jgi:hypothetical protein
MIEAIMPEIEMAELPAQNEVPQNRLSCFSDNHDPSRSTKTTPVKDEPNATSLFNFEIEISPKASLDCTEKELSMQLPSDLDNLGNTCSTNFPDPDNAGFEFNLQQVEVSNSLDPKSYSSESSSRELTESFHCQDLAYSMLGRLSIAPNMSEHPSQIMDGVVNPGRQVMDDLPQLLCCTCPRTPNLAMLCASLIFKILRLYKPPEAYNSECATSQSLLTLSRGSLGPPIPPFNTYYSASFNNTTPTSAYADHLTAQDMTPRQQQLIELKKIGDAIDLFCLQDSVTDEVTSILSAMGVWLSFELHGVTMALQF